MQKRFTDIFVKRPVFASCLSLLIFLVGLVSFSHMDVREYPKIEAALVTIATSYAGASSDVIEGFITTPIEEVVSSADGIDYITSTSTEGSSTVNINMKLGFDANTAMTDIANKISSIRSQLPKDILDPVIAKQDAGSIPLLLLNVQSPILDPRDLTDYLLRVLQPQMQMVDGVSQAMIMGERQYAMRIWLDPFLMAARGITGVDVFNAINKYNVIAPAGSLKTLLQQTTLYSSTDLQNQQGFNNILLRNDNGRLVQIKDVGQAQLGTQDTDFSLFIDDKESTFLQISQKSGTNPLTIRDGIMKLLDRMKDFLPNKITIQTFFDSTKFIRASIREVRDTVGEACIFVVLVVFLMIGSLRAVIVPLVAIPLSICGAGIIMLAFGFSINVLTLLAFVLSIGLVVDDAIVVLENVHRHLEVGLTPKQAALVGAREIAFAVIAMTLTLAAVYAPIGFMGGLTGHLFTEFAFTLAGAVIVSGFVALTLSPMMCSKIYRKNENLHVGFAGVVDKVFTKVRFGYKNALHFAIKFRFIIVIVALVIYGSCYLLYRGLQNELAPEEDQGAVFAVVYGPSAANIDYTTEQTKHVMNLFKQMVPERESYFVVNGYPNGVSSAFGLAVLKDWDKRKRTAMQIRDSLMFPMWSIPGLKAIPFLPASLPGVSGFTPVQLVLNTTESYNELEQKVNKFIKAAQEWGGVVNINSDLQIDKPQINIDVDRDKADDLGISMSDISTSLNTFLSKPIINYFNMNGRSYEVLSRLYLNYRDLPDSLNDLNVRTKTGDLVPLANLVRLKDEVIPQSRNHFQQLRSATISANLAPNVALGTALTHLTKLVKQVIPEGVQVDYAGTSRQYIQSAGTMGALFVFALVFIYLILAAQFESFRDPFIVMLTVPLAIAGAFVGLYICHGTLNIYTEIGLVTLVGLITKNGILIVEFANQQQLRGMEFKTAIIEAASQRLRPILMTTSAMILGALPLMLASGAGAESRRQMGYIIVFGMSFGTLLTLFVIPAMYYLFASHKTTEQLAELEEEELEKVVAGESNNEH